MKKRINRRVNRKRNTSSGGFGVILLAGAGLAAAMAVSGNKSSSIPATQPAVSPNPVIPNGFPIKRGSTGELVRNLQHALVKAGGISEYYIKKSGGIDGNYGPGTEAAIRAAGFPVVIDYALYQRMLQDLGRSAASSAEQKAKTKGSGQASIFRSLKKNLLGQYVGDGLIATLPSNTAVGRYMKSIVGDFLLMETEINGRTYRFWTRASEVDMLPGQQFDFQFQSGTILRKPQSVQSKIVAFF
jgi:peptidoglycan hydrolase-like protein with peptidoglycan-binding domain